MGLWLKYEEMLHRQWPSLDNAYRTRSNPANNLIILEQITYPGTFCQEKTNQN